MRKSLVLLVAAVILVPAAPAGAARWTVWAGASGLVKRPPPGTPKSAEPVDFYPRTLQIHVGDSVTFKTREGHTVTFPDGRRPQDFQFVVPAAGQTYSGINDFAGSPFWFNGKQKYVYRLTPFISPAGSSTVTDTSFRNRALFGPGPGTPPGVKSSATFRFTRAGTYTLLCLLHYPTMRMRVVVKPRGAPIPSSSAVAGQVANQIRRTISTAKALTTTTAPANTVVAGITRAKVSLLAFLPSKVTVPVGTTVTFTNRSGPDNHNEVFGNPDDPWIKNYLATSDQAPSGQVGPEQIYGTEPPGAYNYDGANHGNGFLVTPVTDTLRITPLFGTTDKVTFTKAGTYHYFCQIHGPDMAGDIVVR